MAHHLFRGLLREINEMEWFAVIADETRDASGSEQSCNPIPWVDSDYTVHEDVVALATVELSDAGTSKMLSFPVAFD